jgi:hypothetical protein
MNGRQSATGHSRLGADSGVGVSVLLRQPDGFEGLGAIQVRAPFDHLPSRNFNTWATGAPTRLLP